MMCAIAGAVQVVDVSPPTRLSTKVQKVRIIGKNQDGYVVRFSGDGEMIQVYSPEMRLVTAKNIDYKGMEGEIQHILLNKSGASVLFLDGDRRQTQLLAQPVNGKFVEAGKPLLIDSFYDRPELVNANLHFKLSLDQNYILFYYPVFRGGMIEKMQLTCMDRGLNVLYRVLIAVNRPERDMEYAMALVDNSGNGYLIFAAEPNGKDRTYGDAFHVVRIDRYDGTQLTFNMKVEKEIFGEPAFDIDNVNGSLLFSGFYDETGAASDPAATGVFYQQLDARNGQVKHSVYAPFQASFIRELTGREPSAMNNRLYTFQVKKMIPRMDGGALIAAESFIKDRREVMTMAPSMMTPYNSYRTINTYTFNDIIAFSLLPDGQLEWSQVMRKKQSSEDDNGFNSSFGVMNQKDRLHFVFMDEIGSSGSVNEYVLNSKGESTRNNLFNQDDKDLFVIPRQLRQVAPDEVLMPSMKGTNFRLVKISF